MKERLWTKHYLFSLLLVFGVNMGYALLNAVMAIYGNMISSSEVFGGYLIASFTIAALFVRLWIKKLNTRFSNARLLMAGCGLTVIAALGYVSTQNPALFMFWRIVHGCRFGISLTSSTTISNAYVPTSRLSEGVGFTSSANTIGPVLALVILGEEYTHFHTLFLFFIWPFASHLGVVFLYEKRSTGFLKGIRKGCHHYRSCFHSGYFCTGFS